MSRFPDPRRAPADAPLAAGGDLEPETLVDAYAHGIFPWPLGDGTLFWWSPDPRGVIPIKGDGRIGGAGLHISRSLRRTLRGGRFRHTRDRAFARVVDACADRPGEGTWILPAMVRAYQRLHELGVAHSVEVWEGDELVGGVYGVACGPVFSGESMFHRVPDASKVALVHLVAHLAEGGFSLLDTQLHTDHLGRMGAVEVDRDAFLDVLRTAPPGRW